MSAVFFPLHYKLWVIPKNFRSTAFKFYRIITSKDFKTGKESKFFLLIITFFVFDRGNQIHYNFLTNIRNKQVSPNKPSKILFF